MNLCINVTKKIRDSPARRRLERESRGGKGFWREEEKNEKE